MERISIVTQSQLTHQLAGKADVSALASKADVADLAGLASKSDLAGKADIADLAGKADIADLAGKADTADMPQAMTQADIDTQTETPCTLSAKTLSDAIDAKMAAINDYLESIL